MKRLFLLLIGSLLLTACSPKIYTIGENYPAPNGVIFKAPLEKKNEIWGSIMRFFELNNISINVVDQGAGFVKSELINFQKYSYGYINKNDNPSPLIKYVVCDKIKDFSIDTTRLPAFINAKIEIFTIPTNDSLEIRIKLEDLKAYDVIGVRNYVYGTNTNSNVTYNNSFYQCKTSGLLENQIANYIKGLAEMPKVNLPISNLRPVLKN